MDSGLPQTGPHRPGKTALAGFGNVTLPDLTGIDSPSSPHGGNQGDPLFFSRQQKRRFGRHIVYGIHRKVRGGG